MCVRERNRERGKTCDRVIEKGKEREKRKRKNEWTREREARGMCNTKCNKAGQRKRERGNG